ncbi:hypothetical protein CR513_29506, partial [Mucuna pruriens]
MEQSHQQGGENDGRTRAVIKKRETKGSSLREERDTLTLTIFMKKRRCWQRPYVEKNRQNHMVSIQESVVGVIPKCFIRGPI